MIVGRHSGTYKGNNATQFSELVLRLDVDGTFPLNMLSGELNQHIRASELGYETVRRYSFVAELGKIDASVEEFAATATLRFYNLPELGGEITVKVKDGEGRASLILTGYGYHKEPFQFPIHRESRAFRIVDLEIDREDGIDPPGAYDPPAGAPGDASPTEGPDRPLTLETIHAHAGVRLLTHGEASSVIETPPDGTWTKAELNNIMEEWFDLRQDDLSWYVYLFCASRYEIPYYTGLMWDDIEPLPRQGAALFYKAIQDSSEERYWKRNYLRTAVHELGHALNLLHSFDNGLVSAFGYGNNWFMLPRPGALSYMNYPWRYPHGYNMPPNHDGTDDFWGRFRWAFDRIELQHIRHHDREDVMFGGDPLGTEGHSRGGREDPREVHLAGAVTPLRLGLRGKRVLRDEVRRFDLMEPVQIELKLSVKESEVGLLAPPDPDTDFLAVYIKDPGGVVKRFRPVVRGCIEEYARRGPADGTATVTQELPLYRLLDVTYGRDGFHFANPGSYLIRAVFRGGANLTTYSNALRLQVGAPRSPKEEKLAADFFDSRKGRMLATGPSPAPRFAKELDFFRRFVAEMGDTAAGRAIAGYLGESLGRRFKAVRRVPGGRSSIETIEPNAEEAIPMLNRALGIAEDGVLLPANDEAPGNLARLRMGIARARLAAMREDIADVERVLEGLRTGVKEAIGAGRPELMQRELRAVEDLAFELRSRAVR